MDWMSQHQRRNSNQSGLGTTTPWVALAIALMAQTGTNGAEGHDPFLTNSRKINDRALTCAKML